MEVYNIKNMVKFTDFLRAMWYEAHGSLEVEIYADYQDGCDMFFRRKAIIFLSNPNFLKIHSAIARFESLCYAHDEIHLFNVIEQRSGDQIKKLSRADFFLQKRRFYERDGQRKNGHGLPMSTLYISDNIFDFFHKSKPGGLFDDPSISSVISRQILATYLEMKKKNYTIKEKIGVKEFFRDIIEPLYPQMNDRDKNFFWRFFTNSESAVFESEQIPS